MTGIASEPVTGIKSESPTTFIGISKPTPGQARSPRLLIPPDELPDIP
jgi:hypothetical protein